MWVKIYILNTKHSQAERSRNCYILLRKITKNVEFMGAYSLGIIIVAITVGSQQAISRLLGFEGKAAGFWTCNLLQDRTKKGGDRSRLVRSVKSVLKGKSKQVTIPSIWILKNIWHCRNSGNDMCSMFLSAITPNKQLLKKNTVLSFICSKQKKKPEEGGIKISFFFPFFFFFFFVEVCAHGQERGMGGWSGGFHQERAACETVIAYARDRLSFLSDIHQSGF